jgi:hypothetical protein
MRLGEALGGSSMVKLWESYGWFSGFNVGEVVCLSKILGLWTGSHRRNHRADDF